jgi:glutamate 5-kinase
MNKMSDLIVVKFGSRALTGEDNSLGNLESNIQRFSGDLAQYSSRLVVVTSGAVFCGKLLTPEIEDPAVLATIGNPALARIWQQSFSEFSVVSSQVLVTHRELGVDTERARLLSVLNNSLSLGVVPIINENDALSDEELKKLIYGGDNDGLAAETAKLLGAKHLVLYTDTDGFLVEGELERQLVK